MNLAIRGIDSSNIKWNNEGSFLNNAHKYLKADFILANPPFNDSDWSGDLLKDDARWKYGIPPAFPVLSYQFNSIEHRELKKLAAERVPIVIARGVSPEAISRRSGR